MVGHSGDNYASVHLHSYFLHLVSPVPAYSSYVRDVC